MTGEAEGQLQLTKAYDTSRRDVRQEKLQGATERLNTIAGNVRKIVADIEWRGEAAEMARGAFMDLAAKLNEHADAINGLRLADHATADPIAQAQQGYEGVLAITEDNRYLFSALMNPGETLEQYRDRFARERKKELDDAVHTAQASLKSAATWDLDTPAPATSPPTPPGGGTGGTGGNGGNGGNGGSGHGGGGGTGGGHGGGHGGGGTSGGSGGGSGSNGGTGSGAGRPDQVLAAPGHGAPDNGHDQVLVDHGQHGGRPDAHLVPGGHAGHGGGHAGWQEVDHGGAGGSDGRGDGREVQWQDASGQWHEGVAHGLQWRDADGQWHQAEGGWRHSLGEWQDAHGRELQWRDADGQWHEVTGADLQWRDNSGAWHDATDPAHGGDTGGNAAASNGPGGAVGAGHGGGGQFLVDPGSGGGGATLVDAPATWSAESVTDAVPTDGAGHAEGFLGVDVDTGTTVTDASAPPAPPPVEGARGDLMDLLARRLGGHRATD